MKKYKEPIDKSSPYRTLGANMVKAPVKQTNEPKSGFIKSSDDLRCKGGK